MTATKAPSTPRPVLSGWCGATNHGRCAGAYGGHPCSCRCHQQPAAVEAPAKVAKVEPVDADMVALVERVTMRVARRLYRCDPTRLAPNDVASARALAVQAIEDVTAELGTWEP